MELIIVILFFALASAICLRLFVGAHLLAESDKNLNHALIWSQNFSECFYGCKGRILQMHNQYPNAFVTLADNETDGSIVVFFDENWNPVDNELEVASYEAVIVLRKDTAANVYSDVNKYGVDLQGNAMTGKIGRLHGVSAKTNYSNIIS